MGEVVDGEGAEPMAALVVLAGDADQAGLLVGLGGGLQGGDAAVAGGEAGGDALEHPGAAEVQAVDVGQLRVGAIGDDAGGEPG